MKERIWKTIKSLIYRFICNGEYQRYLALKLRLIKILIFCGLYEQEHLSFLKNLVSSGDTVIDVGAHYGVYSYALQKIVGAKGCVIAIEPLPELFTILRENLKSFSFVECLNHAASDQSSVFAEISVPLLAEGVPEPALASISSAGNASYKTYSVPCKKLDEIQPKGRLSFIKIDVEAHEAAVISGAQLLIQKHRPVIQVEISSQNFSQALAEKPFGLENYSLKALEGKQLQSVKQIREEGNYYLCPLP